MQSIFLSYTYIKNNISTCSNSILKYQFNNKVLHWLGNSLTMSRFIAKIILK